MGVKGLQDVDIKVFLPPNAVRGIREDGKTEIRNESLPPCKQRL
jgi:hypothetical protein